MSLIRNMLHDVRTARGLAASELARRVGVSRQTIYAIEGGTYVPNTEVTLKLAHELGVSVEELFSLASDESAEPRTAKAEVLSDAAVTSGTAVRLCDIGDGRLVSVPASAAPYFMPEADAVTARQVTEVAGMSDADFSKRLIVAGCDPAIGVLARTVERLSGVEVITAPASSRLALTWLKQGKVHIAGTHLKDFRSGEFNLPVLRREFPREDMTVVTFAEWEEGLVTAPGNPKSIRTVADLTRARVRFINREPGSGSRALLDNQLSSAGIEPARVKGFEREARGHLAAAYAVHTGDADCCLATRSAARAFGLDFVPVQSERYDFVIRTEAMALPGVQQLLDALQRSALRKKLQLFAGYDTSRTGSVVSSLQRASKH